jgi:alpha-ketoglutarate-dependent taurine dioxygenase
MKLAEHDRPSIGRLRSTAARKSVSLLGESPVEIKPLAPGRPLPLVVKPLAEGVKVVNWAARHRGLVEQHLRAHGGILFRGFKVTTVSDFQQLIEALASEPLEYRERSSPRTRVNEHIYTSTDHPPHQSIFLHNENSYQLAWPLKLFFFCRAPAREGGETPIADCRNIFRRIRPEVRDRFIEKKWMYVRNFGDGFGLPWQTVFQSANRAAVEEHCRRNGIEVEWKEGGRLRTRAVRPAVARHPHTGELTWFNHATFFHVSTLEPDTKEALLSQFGPEDLPTNTFYGDGSPIEDSVLEELREIYRQETVAFSWQRGDVLMLDNMLAAHGRFPFKGPREILVGMAEPISARGL